MYTITLGNDNILKTTIYERIMQKSKLVDKLCFLVDPIYNDKDMSEFTVVMEYLLPVSKKYKPETLILSEEQYKGYLKYILPFDTELTSEAGDIELQLTFILADLDKEGKVIQYVRKTSPTRIHITPIAAWSDIIPDDALTVIDQRIIKTDAQIKALNELSNTLSEVSDTLNNSKADNIKLTGDTLQLTSNGEAIGDPVKLTELAESIVESNPEGVIQVIEF